MKKLFKNSGLFLMMLTCGVACTAEVEPKKIHFEKGRLTLETHELNVEVASSPEQLAHGLMFRRSLAANEGMLFIFSTEEVRSFWMKNTFVDLSIGFFDKNKKLIDIQDMKAVGSIMEAPQSYTSRDPAMYALEVPLGWFRKHKIKIENHSKFKIKMEK